MKKNTIKRLATISLVASLGLTLSACSKETYNTEVPYGTLSGNYATVGNTALSNTTLYDMMKLNGYTTFMYNLDSIVLKDTLATLDVNNLEDDLADDLAEIINSMVFSTDDIEAINVLTADEQETAITKFVDSLYVSGLRLTTAEIAEIVVSTTGVSYPTSVKEFFKLDLAKRVYAAKELDELIDKEEIENPDEDSEDEMIDNPYYISDKDIETYYNSTYMNAQDYNAVIIGFNSIADYEAKLSSINKNLNTKEFFIELYNKQYPYKEKLDLDNFDTETIVNADKLANYNSALATFVADADEGMFTTSYIEFGDKVYMIYKTSKISDTKYKDLTSEVKEELYPILKEEIRDSKFTSSFITSKVDEAINDLIKDEKITIYDPVFALAFASRYDYEHKDAFDANNVADINGTKISVEDMFNELEDLYAMSITLDYFTNVYIANDSDTIAKLTSDEKDDAEDAYDTEVNKFKTNGYSSYGLTSNFSEAQFLEMKFGFTNKNDVIKYYFQPLEAKKYYTETYDDLYFSLLEEAGKQNYENYFNLNIKHVLLYVDYDLDGNMDNPVEFMNKLSAEDLIDFKNDIVQIYYHVYKEASFLEAGEEKALDMIVDAYEQNGRINYLLGDYKSWAEVKGKFNIQMKVESLGTVDTSSASNYVAPFSAHVETMYFDLLEVAKDQIKDDVSEDDEKYQDKLDDAFEELLGENNLEEITNETNFDDLCITSFGFHMLLSTGGKTATSAKFLEENDYKLSSDNEYKAYQNIDVTLNDEEIKGLNGYSTNNYPSINQLKVYVAELNTDDGVESLKSSTETIIDGFYSTFTTNYTNSQFVNLMLLSKLNIEITFTNADNNAILDAVIEINERTLYGYKDVADTPYANWFDIINK